MELITMKIEAAFSDIILITAKRLELSIFVKAQQVS